MTSPSKCCETCTSILHQGKIERTTGCLDSSCPCHTPTQNVAPSWEATFPMKMNEKGRFEPFWKASTDKLQSQVAETARVVQEDSYCITQLLSEAEQMGWNKGHDRVAEHCLLAEKLGYERALREVRELAEGMKKTDVVQVAYYEGTYTPDPDKSVLNNQSYGYNAALTDLIESIKGTNKN